MDKASEISPCWWICHYGKHGEPLDKIHELDIKFLFLIDGHDYLFSEIFIDFTRRLHLFQYITTDRIPDFFLYDKCNIALNQSYFNSLWSGGAIWWCRPQSALAHIMTSSNGNMETFSASLAVCAGNSPVTGEFPAQRQVTRSFDVFFDLGLNKRLSKQSWGWWFEMPSHSLWHHCNG